MNDQKRIWFIIIGIIFSVVVIFLLGKSCGEASLTTKYSRQTEVLNQIRTLVDSLKPDKDKKNE